MRDSKTAVPDEWLTIEQLTRDFKKHINPLAWYDQEFHPEKFTVEDYQKLEEINLARRALIQAANRRSRTGFYPPGTGREQMALLRNIEFETLAIEGIGEHSEEVTHLLNILIGQDSEKAKTYLDLLQKIRSQPDITQQRWDSQLLSLRVQPPVAEKPAAASDPVVSSAKTISSRPTEDLTVTSS